MTSLEDIFVWSDDSWCYREVYEECSWKSDDFYVIKVDSEEYDTFIEENA